MQKLLFTILTFTAILFTGCSSDHEQINKSDLESLIIKAISNDQDANVKLQGLLTPDHQGKIDYNQLSINQLQTKDETIFSVILEYPDPRLNRFAIYDGQMNLLLLDKSINGYMSSEWVQLNGRKFIFLQESFLTKDVLNIDRLSIYEIDNGFASMVYRAPSRFVEVRDTAYQTVESIDEDFIITKLSGIENIKMFDRRDTFYFNTNLEKYLSNKDKFEKFVEQKIENFTWITTRPQITDEFKYNTTVSVGKGYKISFGDDWQKISNFKEERHLKKALEGVKYINDNNGASFTIFEIPVGEDGDDYSHYKLSETKNGVYRIRTSVFELGENYLQLFEYSCGNMKYLLLFECPKSVYLENRMIFSEIINSFQIDC
jgi:hypothetical protein